MRCPFCNNPDTSVKDSRTTEDLSSVKRRRFCEQCGSRFTTFERIHLRELMVVKKNGLRVVFDRDKLAKSINTAAHKRRMESDQLEKIVSGITHKIETSGDFEITTTCIGEMVMQALATLDQVAYIRFASIYHDFSSVDDFVNFIKTMKTA